METRKPEYLKLYEYMRGEITRGVWPAGSRLPSRRQMALDRALSAVTVEHSYELLCQEGYVQARPRSGYYVSYRSADGFAAVRIAPQPGGLKWLKASMPTPKGMVAVDLRFEGDRATGTATLPEGLPGTFAWKGLTHPLQAGVNQIGSN